MLQSLQYFLLVYCIEKKRYSKRIDLGLWALCLHSVDEEIEINGLAQGLVGSQSAQLNLGLPFFLPVLHFPGSQPPAGQSSSPPCSLSTAPIVREFMNACPHPLALTLSSLVLVPQSVLPKSSPSPSVLMGTGYSDFKAESKTQRLNSDFALLLNRLDSVNSYPTVLEGQGHGLGSTLNFWSWGLDTR